jgi:hypothetical protein
LKVLEPDTLDVGRVEEHVLVVSNVNEPKATVSQPFDVSFSHYSNFLTIESTGTYDANARHILKCRK